MLISKKSLIIAICLFVIAFKVAAGSIFIQSAIERAQLQSHACMTALETKSINSNDASDDQQPVHTMYLMSHVTADIGETQIYIPVVSEPFITFAAQDDRLYFDNIPDSVFKPPKISSDLV